MDLLVVITTVPTRGVGRKLAKILLEEKLVAAVQLHGPIESHYWWRGKIRRAREWSLSLRTTSGRYAKVQKQILENHPYEVPEIFSMKITKTHARYSTWLSEYSSGKKGRSE